MRGSFGEKSGGLEAIGGLGIRDWGGVPSLGGAEMLVGYSLGRLVSAKSGGEEMLVRR